MNAKTAGTTLLTLGLVLAIMALVVSCQFLLLQTSFIIGAIDGGRFDESEYNLDGSAMADSVLKLTNTANFGRGGTVRPELHISATASNKGDVTESLLSGFDLFFIGYFADLHLHAFTSDELDAFYNWVSGGGVMIVTCDSSLYDAVCDRFGYPSSSGATSPTVPTGNNALFNGPFGTVTSVGMDGTKGYFPTSTGAIVRGVDSGGSSLATVMEKHIGQGTVLFLSDIDMVTSWGGISAGAAINNDNDRFLANLFYYATQQVNP